MFYDIFLEKGRSCLFIGSRPCSNVLRPLWNSLNIGFVHLLKLFFDFLVCNLIMDNKGIG